MIVADTGGVLALLNAEDRHHARVRQHFERFAEQWVLPWAILPEVDYLAARRLGDGVARDFAADLAEGRFAIDNNTKPDLARAVELLDTYEDLGLGLGRR